MASQIDNQEEGRSRGRVVPTDSLSVEKWARELGVTAQELLAAVLRVGTWPAAIERQLGQPKDYR